MTFVCFPLSLVGSTLRESGCDGGVARAETTRKTKSGGGGGVISATHHKCRLPFLHFHKNLSTCVYPRVWAQFKFNSAV